MQLMNLRQIQPAEALATPSQASHGKVMVAWHSLASSWLLAYISIPMCSVQMLNARRRREMLTAVCADMLIAACMQEMQDQQMAALRMPVVCRSHRYSPCGSLLTIKRTAAMTLITAML